MIAQRGPAKQRIRLKKQTLASRPLGFQFLRAQDLGLSLYLFQDFGFRV